MNTEKNKPLPWTLNGLAMAMLAIAGIFTLTSAIADDEEREERREGDRERKVERDGDRERPEARDRDGDAKANRERVEERRDAGREHDGGRNREHDDDRPEAERSGDLPPEVREFIEQVEKMQREVHELARAGKRDEAHALEKKIHGLEREHPEMIERFRALQRGRENTEIQNQMRELQAHLKKELEAGNETEAREIRKHMEEIHLAVRRRDEGEHAEKRIHHLRQAAENLAAAGLHDQARELHQQVEEIEADLREHHAEGRDRDLARHAEHLEHEIAELKEVVGDLREHVEKLQHELRQAKGERD